MKLLGRLLRLFFTHFYTTLAWSYDAVAWLVSLGKWNDWVRGAIPSLKRDPVLELGHGTGHLLVELNRRRQVFGLDASRQMGRIAARRLQRAGHPLRLVRAKAEALPFASSSFGSIVSTFPTEYILLPGTLSQAWRVLEPGGDMVVLPMAETLGRSPLDRFARWLFRTTGQSGELTDAWLQPFQATGFEAQRDELRVRNSRVVRVIGRRPAAEAGS